MLKKLIKSLLASPNAPELIVSTVVINLLGLGSSLYSIHLMNRYVTIGLAPTLVTLTLGVLIAIAFEVMLRRQRQAVLMTLSHDNDMHASQRVFGAFSGARLDALNKVPLAVRREGLGAPATIQQLGSVTNLGALLDLPFCGFYLVAATLLYWPLGLFGLAACVWALVLGALGERRQRVVAEEHAKASSRAQQLSQFLLTAGETIRALPLVGPLSRRWGEVQSASLGSRRAGMVEQSNMQNTIQMVGQLLTVVVYAFGAAAAVRGDLTTGALIGANILVSRGFAVCSRAAYLADPILRADRADKALQAAEAAELESSAGSAPATLSGRLEVVDVAFSYPQQPVPLFERLDIEAQPGQVIAISGPNGAGKSTLIKVMLGLLTPLRGMVRADGIELRQLSQEWWRAHIGYAPQEPVFFDGTLRENLLLDRDIADEQVIGLIRDMGLESFLAQDPQGLDRAMSSHESGMAVGMRRRFALIRAVLGDPKVVFLDDPTEGLDQAGHAAVAKLLNRLLTEKRTIVVASNEAFILRAADVVVEMDKKPVPAVVRNVPQIAGDKA
ncbi:ATP-binding cassette domain-containing protein [Aquabacterium sp.]|uniref:ATP-binding cassette domain-containing protein n=1 Tax=Aquabacterium sp. TaxID=1872578 RepID=UPI003B6DC535